MQSKIEYTSLSNLFLDRLNPRLGRAFHSKYHSQLEILREMRDWSLEELATSFLESGFWAHEAVLCCEEDLDGTRCLVVVEGNRRVAALKRLKMAFEGEDQHRKWLEMVKTARAPKELFSRVPFIRVSHRDDVSSFLGFRHVTGIKEWAPPEKAEFIYQLIKNHDLSYRDVMRRIGSTTPVVERNYIAYCILLQMEDNENLAISEVEKRFSVLFLSLRSKKIQRFLGIEEKFGADPNSVYPPISGTHLGNLESYSLWLFGDGDTPSILTDSREIEKFAYVLDSEKGLQYLRSVKRPDLETAFVIAGGSIDELHTLIATAAYGVQDTLSTIHLYKDDEELVEISKLLILNTDQLKLTLGI